MGTRGYRIYRSKGRYHILYNHLDSYPDGFGLQVLYEIPRGVSKEEFEKWVTLTREDLDTKFTELDSDPRKNEYVLDEHPEDDIFIEWVYVIDLDNLVFHVNRMPMFRLDNMPPDDVFVKSISYNHFGHKALDEHTPIQYRYNWRAPPPSPPPKSSIAYTSCPNRSSTSSIHELLRTPMTMSSIERARTTLVGPLITRLMTERSVCICLRGLEAVPDRRHIPKRMLKLALSFVNFAVGLPNPSMPCNPSGITWDCIWIRKDVCLCITTHLDDEENLQASIGHLIRHIDYSHKVGTIYGIACSIFHCAIVRLDKDERGTSFAHTPALEFLPSFYAREIRTPGIEALSRLGCQASGVEFLDAISEAHNRPCLTHGRSRSVASKVPVEVWTNVGNFITSPIDLVNLAHISPQALSAAADLARYPWVLDYRLVDAFGSISPLPETTEDINEIEQYHLQLGRAKFTAVKDGRHVTVELREYGTDITKLRVVTYMDGSLGIWAKELHVFELDDD
jgi:hypothetical protein